MGLWVTKWALINLHLQDVPPAGTAAAQCCASIVKTSGQQFIWSRLQVHTIHVSKPTLYRPSPAGVDPDFDIIAIVVNFVF